MQAQACTDGQALSTHVEPATPSNYPPCWSFISCTHALEIIIKPECCDWTGDFAAGTKSTCIWPTPGACSLCSMNYMYTACSQSAWIIMYKAKPSGHDQEGVVACKDQSTVSNAQMKWHWNYNYYAAYKYTSTRPHLFCEWPSNYPPSEHYLPPPTTTYK